MGCDRGSKFRAVSSARSVRERQALKRYLDELESADAQDEVVIDPSAVAAALEKLKKHSEPEAAAAIDGGTSVCRVEVPHLRASAFPVARPERSTNRDEPRGDGL